jgi:PAS domain S-box-containing protein
MEGQSEAIGTAGGKPGAPSARGSGSVLWQALALAAIALAAAAVGVGLAGGHGFTGLRKDEILVLAMAAVVAVLAVRVAIHARRVGTPAFAGQELKEVLDSAGLALMAVNSSGHMTYVNPAAERLLSYHAAELQGQAWDTMEILAAGEEMRLVAEIEKRSGAGSPAEPARAGWQTALFDYLRGLAPSAAPSFDVQLRRKDGSVFPAALHISGLWVNGELAGLVAVAEDKSATLDQEQELRESQDRYRDLFENSNEMIATISPAGCFLYANPAWKRCFGLDHDTLLNARTFEELFSESCRSQASDLFRRALDGMTVERAPLRHRTADGRVFDLELSLSQRQQAGNPLAVRCLLRDVTQQKQREQRLALQLMVSQIIGENISPQAAVTRILEALCISQEWDAAINWTVNAKAGRLEFDTAWGAPGSRAETLIQESIGQTVASGSDLAGRAWKEGRTVWIDDLAAAPESPRIQFALRQRMAAGWAVPVRVGNSVLAVLEFYCRFRLREDKGTLAVLEAAAAALGQMQAHSQEQGRAEELSRQQEILLNAVADGICGVDRHGLVSFANPAAARLLGTEVAVLTGKPVHELLHGSAPPERRCGDDCQLRSASASRKAAAGEDAVFRTDGSAFPAEYVFTPILDQGSLSGSVLSFRDISQRYALDRLKDEFISTVSHELRTPLTSIRGSLGLLSSGILGDVNEKAANLLRIALTNSDRLVRLINDILDLERIQSERTPLAFRPVQLAEIVQQAIEGMQPVAEAGGVRLMRDSTEAEIAADPDRLLQVLTNLISNAIKFSPPNSTVSVMLRPGKAGVTIAVIDQGRGIPADKLEAIFGRFQQVDASDSRQKGGSGLGLAICRTIVLQHSGRIWAERNPVRGSTFRVFLPYRPAPLETPDHTSVHESARAAPARASGPRDEASPAGPAVPNP